jgi:hypothetical protein
MGEHGHRRLHLVRNHNERGRLRSRGAPGPTVPGPAHNHDLLADVACVALNRLPPRYIRHQVDFMSST